MSYSLSLSPNVSDTTAGNAQRVMAAVSMDHMRVTLMRVILDIPLNRVAKPGFSHDANPSSKFDDIDSTLNYTLDGPN